MTRRLGFAWKFLVILAVLAVPLVMMSRSLIDVRSESRQFAAGERDGLVYISPATELLELAIEARTGVAEGEIGPDRSAIDSFLAEIEAAHDAVGLAGAAQPITSLATSVEAALGNLEPGVQAYQDWTAVVDAANAVIVSAADESGLVLDPELSTYYLMDALVLTLPQLRIDVADVHDALHMSAEDPNVDLDVVLAGAGAEAQSLATRFDAAIAKVVGAGEIAGLATDSIGPSVEQLLASADEVAQATDLNESAVLAALVTLTEQLEIYEQSGLTQLDRALADRVADRLAAERRTLLISGAAIVVALYFVGAVVFAVRRSSRPVVRSLQALSEGRFVVPDVPTTSDELGAMANSVRTAVEFLSRDFVQIEQFSRQLADAAVDLGAVSAQLGQSSRSSSAACAEVSDTVDMQASIREIASNAAVAAEVGRAARRATAQASDDMHRLDERSREISAMVDVIGKIAAQTNLLALNATIEAARAGIAGRGFAVVADEVKQLAGRTAEAAETIVTMIGQIHDGTSSAGASLADISSVTEQVHDAQQSISAAVEQQSAMTDAIAGRLELVTGDLTSTGAALRTIVDRYEFSG